YFAGPTRRFGDAVPNPRQEQRRQSTDGKHGTPTVAAADKVIRNRGKENADVVARMHVTSSGAAATFRPFFGDECAAHGPLTADSNSSKESKNRQLPDAGDEGAQKRKDRVPHDGQHQRTDTPKLVAHRSPQESQPPTNQEKSKEQSTVVTDVAFRCGDAGARKKIAKRGQNHKCVDERIHAVESPSTPCGPKPSNLIASELDVRRQ